ncbi:hypothetical protein P153DRAFT_280266 [Dothidotthia symphoricarpi CBS 119687]|uniref:Mid2 domain-containing protein n=1 Tax=Dothidotthia symphoricarpi CBS 119687 TaxID=1392245 RepID=A0A6A6ASX3_9PLEO|nr:uncharacterized protein P153DRAFT_280266 [Dothidotthia symphoricarpi CBS 119687]KAF2134075.1 hypothetical protein P153DRAFT_280266 [Dothidotthia symphoricarpi CBS 119687]
MAPLPSLSKLSRIATVFFLTSLITTTQAASLFPRQAATCGGNTGLQQCGGTFPSSFCCPADTTCMSLNSGDVQSVICCPAGSDCAYVQTITCDVTQLNATLHPDNQVHLSDTTNVELPTCGDKCCPLGYSCKGSMCSKDTSSSPTPTSSTTATSTASATPSSTLPASASQTSGCPAPVQTQQGFDGKSFAAGLFPGIVIGALGALGLLWVIRKRRESQANRYSGDFGHVTRQISDPIYDPQHAARTDFMRRGSQSVQPSPNSSSGMIQNKANTNTTWQPVTGTGLTPRIKSMWDRTPSLNFGFSPAAPAAATVRAGRDRDPYTTPRQTPKRIHSQRRTSRTQNSDTTRVPGPSYRPAPARAESTETIDVLMPAPSFLEPPRGPAMHENRFTAASNNTTFTKLMERAGFNEEERRDCRSPEKF